MECVQQQFLLQKAKVLRLENLALRQGHIFEGFSIEMQHVLNQPKFHVLVHVSLSQEITGGTGSKEVVGLNVDVVTPPSFVLHHFVIKIDILLVEAL